MKTLLTRYVSTCLIMCLGFTAAADHPSGKHSNDVFDMSLSELTKLTVSVASREESSLNDTPAAVYVISQDDIASSGLSSIAEALRLAPGFHVARIDANKWAVASRGMNERFNRFQQVKMDGRNVYTPLFSGVIWPSQDTIMEDIQKIEVIRGPGSSLWGANAVNGVTSVVTKSAHDTQGWLLSAGTGSEEHANVGLRYGFKLNDSTSMRVYVRDRHHDEFKDSSAFNFTNPDRWRKHQMGFRLDWDRDVNETFTVQGDFHYGQNQNAFFVPDPTNAVNSTPTASGIRNVHNPARHRGGNLLLRWKKPWDATKRWDITTYVDHMGFTMLENFRYRQHTASVDAQLNWEPHERHRLVLGVGDNVVWDRIRGDSKVDFNEPQKTFNTFNVFAQDTVSLVENHLEWTIGIKLEYNDHTHWQPQPNTRFMGRINDQHRVWAALSKATRTPSRVNDDVILQLSSVQVAPGTTQNSSAIGKPDYLSESVHATELGYRFTPNKKWHLDIASFYNKLRKGDGTLATANPLIQEFVNQDQIDFMGVEATTTYQPNPQTKIFWSHTQQKGESVGPLRTVNAEQIPRSLGQVRISHQWNTAWRGFGAVYYHGPFDTSGFGRSTPIKRYARLDLGVQHAINNQWEIGLWGQNLLEGHHSELDYDGFISVTNGEIPRSVFIKLTGRF